VLLQINVTFILVDVEIVLCDFFESLDGIDEVSGVELVVEIPTIRLELG